MARCGISTNVCKQIKELSLLYGKKFNVRLETFAWVSTQQLIHAEKYIDQDVGKYRFDHHMYRDLVILPQGKSASAVRDIFEIARALR